MHVLGGETASTQTSGESVFPFIFASPTVHFSEPVKQFTVQRWSLSNSRAPIVAFQTFIVESTPPDAMSHSDRAVRHIGHRRRPSGCRFAYPFPDTPLTCLRHPIGNQDDEREALQLAARQHEATVNAAKAAVQGRNRTGRNAASIVRELETRLAAVIAEKQELASSLMRTLAECTRARDDAAAAREALNVVREAGERAATALEVEESARRRDAEHAKAAAEMHSTALASAHAEIDNLRRGHAEIMAATDAEVERLCVRNRTVEAALVKAEKSLNEQETMLKEAKQRASQTSEELRCEHDRVVRTAGKTIHRMHFTSFSFHSSTPPMCVR